MDKSDSVPVNNVYNEKYENLKSPINIEQPKGQSESDLPSSSSMKGINTDDDTKRHPKDGSICRENEAKLPTDANNDDDEEDAAKLIEKIQTLKGDRIGETMYSERFVLSSILKLSQRTDVLLEDDEEFERDLCNLWDMTIEPDVVGFLLQQDVIELFLALATRSKDYRLIEILFGIVGNMCCVDEMHDYMYRNSDLLLNLCDFLAVPDAPVLVQLMRTLTTLFDRSDDEKYRWFGVMKRVENLTEKLSFILATSTNRVLLEHSVETISAMINRFTEAEVNYAQIKEFYCIFAKSCLPEGLFEAFRQLYPAKEVEPVAINDDFDEGIIAPKDLKTMRRFLEIHEHFIVNANELYEHHVEEVAQCVYRVLVSFVSESMLFPLTKNHVSMLVSINNIYSGIMYHFHADSFVCMIHIYENLAKKVASHPIDGHGARESSPENVIAREWQQPMQEDDLPEDDEGEFDAETACVELLEAMFYLVGPIDEQIIRSAVQQSQLTAATIERLCKGMREAMDGDPLLYQTCTKLMNTVSPAEDAITVSPQSKGNVDLQ